jgi:hypothetical protein
MRVRSQVGEAGGAVGVALELKEGALEGLELLFGHVRVAIQLVPQPPPDLGGRAEQGEKGEELEGGGRGK